MTDLIATAGRGCLRVLLPGVVAAGAWAAEPSVPYVPTPQDVVERMLQMAKVTSADYVIDLGSGDGRIVITAARKFGARGIGVDLNPERIAEANDNAKKAGVTDRVAFHQQDLFLTSLSEATVITMYLLPRVNVALRPKLLELKPGTRLVSHDFDMDDWKPDRHVKVDAKEKYGSVGGTSDIYFWVVPARVAGTWEWQLQLAGKPRPYALTLTQKYQEISGTATVAGRTARLRKATLNGDRIRFTYTVEVDGAPVQHAFEGRIDGASISGTANLSGGRLQSRLEWSARRVAGAASAPVPFTAVSSAVIH